ncbi:hypothetical protein MUK70_01775 [Dyadobacter chenwenxiniae]|uniref:Uncharacterized protein n=1 Tax=Dyadobacter chenwenxiniae TaxID=2906456 RepID=A0A9X1PLC7_9BACT|nr:hypothetical protein [Dyadobacter chenwenxiniae]MCF0062525.1 hypothetical protein [Dyadobacter chenwenxiniae]UON83730.1 hypothetical protein MUK70_01775 [Dyadobacter chenwenxiniae]
MMVFLLLLSCDDKPAEVVKAKVNKEKVLAALLASGRNWRFEEISIERQGVKTVENLAETSKLITVETRINVTPNVGFRFESYANNVTRLDEIISTGPFGKIPYGAKSLSETGMGLTTDGTWVWDDAAQTVFITSTSSMVGIVSEMSENGWKPEKGYLDNTMLPLFETAGEAQSAGVPERIRIIFEENDAKIGKITYGITLRAAWITRLVSGNSRQQFYDVVY